MLLISCCQSSPAGTVVARWGWQGWMNLKNTPKLYVLSRKLASRVRTWGPGEFRHGSFGAGRVASRLRRTAQLG
jgi:hypothetical protein